MDLDIVIRELRLERERLNNTIQLLETLLEVDAEPVSPKKRAGRKSMGPEERRLVSERLKRYWANHRKRA